MEKVYRQQKTNRFTQKRDLIFSVMIVITAFMLGITLTTLWIFKDNLLNTQNEDNYGISLMATEQEKAIIEVVQSSKDAVITISRSEIQFSQDEGLVDRSSNIGTGFVVDSNGIIVTNQHVVSNTQVDYKVVTSEGLEYPVVEIVRDDVNDIALIKIDANELKTLPLGDSDNLVVGQTVIAIGNPLGDYVGSVTTGVISGLNREVNTSTGWFGSTVKTYEDVIQTDAAVNPGNSGGPLISTTGEVIAINFATTSGADNISFALPINILKQRLDEYIAYGKFIKPYLGISYQMISSFDAMYYKDVVPGALVVRLDPYGPASEAGIKRGEIITKYNGEDVGNSLASKIQKSEVGDEVEIEVWNVGESRVVEVVLDEME